MTNSADQTTLQLGGPSTVSLAGGATVLLCGAALDSAPALLASIDDVLREAPWRVMTTPGGKPMSAAMTNTGAVGWVSDRRGYRYQETDPLSGRPWPAMAPPLLELAARCAHEAGYPGFEPDVCLVNRYEPGARMGLHQDRDEVSFDHPIVSVSLGLPATFILGGTTRGGRTERFPLRHGDVLVWGGPDRLRYHGVAPIAPGEHPATGRCRINLTFRRAG